MKKKKNLIISVAIILAVLACFMWFSSNKENTNGIYASSELRWLARNDLARDGLAQFSAKEPVNGEFRHESMYFSVEEWQNWLNTEKSLGPLTQVGILMSLAGARLPKIVLSPGSV